MWGIFMVFEGTVRLSGSGGFLCFTHSSRSGSEVGIGLVPSFLTVISSHGHWCHSLDFDGLHFAVLPRHLALKGKFPNN